MSVILAIDIGSCRTKAALFDIVEGRHRLIARSYVITTLYSPVEDVSVGVRRAVERVERVSGRAILNGDVPIISQRSDWTGVDHVVITASLGGRMRVLVLTPSTKSPVFEHLQQVVQVAGAELEVLPQGRLGDSDQAATIAILRALRTFRPHGVLVLGVDFGGRPVENLLQCLADARRIAGAERVAVYISGIRPVDMERVAEIGNDLNHCLIDLDAQDDETMLLSLERMLAALWERSIINGIAGLSHVLSWQDGSVEHTFFATGRSLRFLSNRFKADLSAVDIGASSVSLFQIKKGAGQARLSLQHGVGRGVISILEDGANTGEFQAGYPEIRRLLPKDLEVDLGAAILNKWARPWVIPETEEEMFLERAFAVTSVRRLRAVLGSRPPMFKAGDAPGLIVGAGATIAGQRTGVEMATALLDALEPAGLFEMKVDRDSILALLGKMANVCPEAAAEVLLGDACLHLGTCLACTGQARLRKRAAVVEVKSARGSQTIELHFGDVRVIPLGPAEKAEIAVKPDGALDFGWGKGKAGKAVVSGGSLGLLIDARGRPLGETSSPV